MTHAGVMKGLVTKAGFMDKTVTVTVNRLVQDRKTRKTLIRSTKFLTHDAENALKKDDLVLIRQCPPLSKQKAHTLHEILFSPETTALAARPGLFAAAAAEHTAKSRALTEKAKEGEREMMAAKALLEAGKTAWRREAEAAREADQREEERKRAVEALAEGRVKAGMTEF